MKKKIKFYIILAFFALLTVIFLDLFDCSFNKHDIIVESHGLVFDLIVFGILITIYESIDSKNERIKRYREELEDFYGWESEDAKYRVKGIIKRLVKLKAQKIDLSGCSVEQCPYTRNMREWNFSNAKLFNSTFIYSNMSGSSFYLSENHNSKFSHADLSDCKFELAILDDCSFDNCNLENTDFKNAYVNDNNWFNILKTRNNKGLEYINNKFYLSSDSILIDSKAFFQVLCNGEEDIVIDRNKIIGDEIRRLPLIPY